MPTIRPIASIQALAELRLLWRALADQTPGASFFQSLEWLECYWQHYGDQQRLKVLVVETNGQVLGILPLVVRTEATAVGPVRVLTYPLDYWGSFFGPIGPNPTITLLAGLQYLRDRRRDWDVLDLKWVDAQGADRGRTPRTLAGLGMAATTRQQSPVSLVDLSAGWDAYWAARKSHFRSNVNRAERLLAKQGEVTFERHRPAGAMHGDCDPAWDWLDDCFSICQRSWQGQAASGVVLSQPSIRHFITDVHRVAAERGALDMCMLRVGGRPAAFAYNYVLAGRVYGFRMGFDPEFDNAGIVLMRRALESSAALGDQTIDLGPDYLEPKRYWRTSLPSSYQYTHYALGSLRAQAIRLGRAAKGLWVPYASPSAMPVEA